MASYNIDESQRRAARVAGFTYLFVNATFAFAEFFVNAKLIVFNDASKTVANITAHEQLFRLGVTADLLTFAADVALLTALYVILKPVSRGLALLAAFWRVTAAAILTVAVLNNLNILQLVRDSGSSLPIEAGRLRAAGLMLSIEAHGDGSNVGLLFIALGSTVFSYLWFKSRYIPRPLAVWGVLASSLGVASALAFILFPDMPEIVGLLLMPIAVLFELTLGFWLLIRGLQPDCCPVAAAATQPVTPRHP